MNDCQQKSPVEQQGCNGKTKLEKNEEDGKDTENDRNNTEDKLASPLGFSADQLLLANDYRAHGLSDHGQYHNNGEHACK